jgi:DNA-binding NarL/FixJ family response regulator
MNSMPKPIVRVLLADDSALVRTSLRALLEPEPVTIVGEVADGHDAVRLAAAQDVDVAILDLMMPGLNGIEATRQIRQESRRTRVLLVTGHTEEYQILAALDAGAIGYVAKRDAGEELARAIDEVFRGNRYLSAAISRVVAGRDLVGRPEF